jgi:hypothetical protein
MRFGTTMEEIAWRPRKYRVKALTTRPVVVAGDEHMTAFTKEALESLAKQMRESFIPASLEHLSFLPPVARWVDGEVTVADDGESELTLDGEDLRQFVAQGPVPDPLMDVDALEIFSPPSGEIPVEVRYEGRNFDSEALTLVMGDCPLPTTEELRWSALPPIEWILAIPVMWGAVKFAGGFFDELGHASARRVAGWLCHASSKAKAAERDRIVTVDFEITCGRSVHAIIPVKADAPEQEIVLENALNSLGGVASLAGMIRDGKSPLPGVERATFMFDGTAWQLAWWTDGKSVYRTAWFEHNKPDPARFLGRPFVFEKESGSTELPTPS